MKLKNKNAIVTGSTSGIGEGIARALAAEGCNLLIHGLGEKAAIDALCKEIETKYNIKVAFSGDDLSKPEAVAAMVKKAEDAFGQVDILVNNAGIQHVANVEDFPPEKWDAVIAINLTSAFHGIRLTVGGMKKRGWGRIINVASAHGLVASAQKSAYVAAKHGLLGLNKAVGLEVAGTGVTCNAICPGWVLTPLVQKQIDDRAKAGGISVEQSKINLLSEKQPSKQFVQVEELGALAVFLCSDAAVQMTGTSLSMDGGWTAQ